MDLPLPPEMAAQEETVIATTNSSSYRYADEADEVMQAVVNNPDHADDLEGLDFEQADREMERVQQQQQEEDADSDVEVEASVLLPGDPFSPGGQTVEAFVVDSSEDDKSPTKLPPATEHNNNNNNNSNAPMAAEPEVAAATTETTSNTPVAAIVAASTDGNTPGTATTCATPPVAAATPKLHVNFDDLDDIPNRIDTHDIVLVNANASSENSTKMRAHSALDRRRRLFASKMVNDDGHDKNETQQRKRPSRKCVMTAGSAGADRVKWEDLFHSPTKVKLCSSNRDNKSAAAAKSKATLPHKPALVKKGGGTQKATANNTKPEEVYRGPPTEEIEGGWPAGWIKTEMTRKTGNHRDRYWFTPGGKKLRSMVEVKKFLLALNQNDQNEELAWKVFRSVKL